MRAATFHDTLAVGQLIQVALPLSPSSTLNEGAIPHNAFITGSELLEGPMTGIEDLLIAEMDEEIAAMAHLKPKELVRSRHVARLQLLIHPDIPREPVEDALMQAALERGAERGLTKVVIDVAHPDLELAALVERGQGWWSERVRRGALRWQGSAVDVTTWARWIRSPQEVRQTPESERS
ncbi:MAG: GNAT family N-acetyltransferase [Myxococcota bacterium]|nr:GNAT family N-acetyltransferase [Myxococcota bacterium]